MTLETISGNAVRATLTANDMKGYHISFGTMSADDSATQTLLSDMLSVMKHIGLRHFGDRVTAECRSSGDGGCVLQLTVTPPERWLFSSAADLFFAMRSGALPKQMCTVDKVGSGWLLTPKQQLSPDETSLLAEFSFRYESDKEKS